MNHLIGIGGGTGAGKSALVFAFLDRYDGIRVDLDSYYLDRSTTTPEARAAINYDEPAAIDITLLMDHLIRLKAGETVSKPRYSFQTHTRVGIESVVSTQVILVDGLFTLWWKELRALFDLKVFVDAPADLRLLRRVQRDVTERGRSVESVLAQYLETVRPMHERYVEPTKAFADLVVKNEGLVEECVEPVVAAVEALLSRSEPCEKKA